MRRLATAAFLGLFMDGSTLAQPATAPPAQRPADTGEQIQDGAVKAGTAVKEGAVKLGETVKQRAVKVGDTVKQGAIDLWAAGKAAIATGGDTLDKRRAARDKGKDPDAATGNK
jgi:hypothetical protein